MMTKNGKWFASRFDIRDVENVKNPTTCREAVSTGKCYGRHSFRSGSQFSRTPTRDASSSRLNQKERLLALTGTRKLSLIYYFTKYLYLIEIFYLDVALSQVQRDDVV